MKVILLTDVAKVGHKYEVKEVANGYAANYLIPRKMAEVASPGKVKGVEALQKKAVEERKIQEELLAKNLDSLGKVKITMTAKANEKGHLFQGIHKAEIREALAKDAHLDMPEDMIELKEPIKALGEFQIEIKAGDKQGAFTLVVDPEK